MENAKSKGPVPKAAPGRLANACWTLKMADRIRMIIRAMPQIEAPRGLLPSVMKAVKAKSDPI